MARINNKIYIKPKAVIAVVIAIGVVLIPIFLITRDRFSNLQEFPEESYLNADNLWGNAEYLIKGTFQNVLVPPTGKNAVISSIVSDNKGGILPVIIPQRATRQIYERGQKIKLKVHLDQEGRIIAEDSEIQ